jgi:hypothetical protein
MGQVRMRTAPHQGLFFQRNIDMLPLVQIHYLKRVRGDVNAQRFLLCSDNR